MASLLSQQPVATEKKHIFDSGIRLNAGRFVELYSAAAAWSAVTQRRAAEFVVMNRQWNADFALGTLSFGEDSFPMQIIGAETDGGSYLWAWANRGNQNPASLTLAGQLRRLGEETGNEVFINPQFMRTQLYNGYSVSAVAAMLAETPCCYFRCPHAGGSVFVTFSRLPENIFMPVNKNVFTATLVNLARQVPADHRIMTEALLYLGNVPYERSGEQIAARFDHRQRLLIRFDTFHRIIEFSDDG